MLHVARPMGSSRLFSRAGCAQVASQLLTHALTPAFWAQAVLEAPISIAMYVCSDFYSYRSGVYNTHCTDTSPTFLGGHAGEGGRGPQLTRSCAHLLVEEAGVGGNAATSRGHMVLVVNPARALQPRAASTRAMLTETRVPLHGCAVLVVGFNMDTSTYGMPYW